MNKVLFLGLAATALMSSCSSDEVLESVMPQAISFDNAFVDKNTRADITSDNLTNFYVYAAYTDNGNTSNPIDIYTNAEITGSKSGGYNAQEEKFWVADKDYRFIAYSNGNSKIGNNLVFENTTGNLTIKSYTVGANDLILSNIHKKAATSTSGNGTVDFTFKHLLSKVKFTFTSGFGASSKMSITNLTFNSNNTGNYTNSKSTWSTSNSTAFTYTTISDIAGTANKSSEDKYVLPQGNGSLRASFTVTVLDANNVQIAKQTFSDVALTTTPSDNWEAGYVYNYTATISKNSFTETAEPIKFTVTTVKGWSSDKPATDITPKKK